jgi:hypothetical protein
MLLFLLFAPIVLNACSSGGSDPPVTPDTTIPSTLLVTVTIAEDQEASDGAHGMSVITLGFSTNETIPPSQVIFISGENVICNGSGIALGNAVSYWVRVAIPYDTSYTCLYHYFLHGNPHIQTATIFNVHAASAPLSPVLHRPVIGGFQVHYTPGTTITHSSNCTVQVTANAPNQSASGDTVPQSGSTYTGSDASGLNGLGNIVMTRSCIPISYNHDNDADDTGLTFAAVNVTYTSTASYEVSWVPPGSPTQGTNS